MHTGYKVGRVDQVETALGAEMRLAADKSKGNSNADKAKDKIVRRYVVDTVASKDLFTQENQRTQQGLHKWYSSRPRASYGRASWTLHLYPRGCCRGRKREDQ